MKSALKTSVVTLALAGFALAGCNSPTPDDTAATPDQAAVPSETAVFDCPGGETITAEFDGTETAIVTLPDQEPVTLTATEAASGARYTDGTTTFWNKGDEALVEVNDEIVLSDCAIQN